MCSVDLAPAGFRLSIRLKPDQAGTPQIPVKLLLDCHSTREQGVKTCLRGALCLIGDAVRNVPGRVANKDGPAGQMITEYQPRALSAINITVLPVPVPAPGTPPLLR